MEQVRIFLVEWWPLIVLVAGVTAKVINIFSHHWSEHQGVKRTMLKVVDALDLLKASSRPKLKGLLVLLVAGSMMAGCGTTFKQALDGAHRGIKVVSTVYEPALQAECLERARACNGKVIRVEQCTPYITCRDVQRQLADALILTHKGLGATDQARRAAENAGLLKGGQ
ncbi:MAG TPA: hypothetical protein ENL34_10230 [Chloroflexi bacterium]|nr:hypothetical protein [Chloroflexota bacterium]